MSETAPTRPTPPPEGEALPLAQQMHAALADLIERYRRAMGLSAQEALAQVGKADTREAERILTLPPDQPTWLDLSRLADRDAGATARLWEEIKAAALDELRSGHRAAGAMLASSPWERARFLAIRRELAEQWRPRGGVEWQLVEAMAQAQAAWTFWLEAMMRWAALGVGAHGRDSKDEWGRSTPRLSEGEAVERAGAMADRFNRIVLRTLRAMRDLRRYAPTVIVQSAGQVNVGGQQVNVAGP
jgi:hypothetical protein